MVLDLMRVHNFHVQKVIWMKMLFLQLMIVLLCMLIIKKDILVPGEGPT